MYIWTRSDFDDEHLMFFVICNDIVVISVVVAMLE